MTNFLSGVRSSHSNFGHFCPYVYLPFLLLCTIVTICHPQLQTLFFSTCIHMPHKYQYTSSLILKLFLSYSLFSHLSSHLTSTYQLVSNFNSYTETLLMLSYCIVSLYLTPDLVATPLAESYTSNPSPGLCYYPLTKPMLLTHTKPLSAELFILSMLTLSPLGLHSTFFFFFDPFYSIGVKPYARIYIQKLSMRGSIIYMGGL